MKLYLKLDHVAGLRTAKGGREPEPAAAAALAELEGVGGITIHLHSDRITVQFRDIQVLKETLSVPLNVELYPSTKGRQHAFDLRPGCVTLVNEPRDVRADRSPLDINDKDLAAGFIQSLHEAEIKASVLISPTIDAVRWAHRIGSHQVLIDTTAYSQAKTTKDISTQLERLSDAVKLSQKLGMEVHAGGGLDYRNVGEIAKFPLSALHIGHGIVARALLVGISKAIRDMMALIEKSR